MQYDVKIKKLPKSEVEMEVSLPADFLVSARKKSIDFFGSSLEISGFRKGHVPENIVVTKIGEGKILEEAVDILLKDHFPKIVEQTKLDIIGQPKISVTKLALENPLEFKAHFSIMPEFTLPDYRAIAKSIMASAKADKKDFTVTDKEIEEVLLQIRKNKAHFDWHQAHPEEKTYDHPEIKDEDLPELNDELAKSAGDFNNLDELKEKIKENLITEKKIKDIEKNRALLLEELIKNMDVDLPEILVEHETGKSIGQMKDDIARMGGNFEDYLKQIKKTEEDLRKDFKESSEKKAKVQLIFNQIAKVENFEPDKTILENEVKEILKHYPNASEANARIYISTLLLNQEVLKLLENQ